MCRRQVQTPVLQKKKKSFEIQSVGKHLEEKVFTLEVNSDF
jgi:hypothetical protein